jgi:hypothetical protein
MSKAIFIRFCVSSIIFLGTESTFVFARSGPERATSAVALGTAGAGRAALITNEVNTLNPAQLVRIQGRSLGFTFRENEFSGTFADHDRENFFPASASYWQKREPLDPVYEIETKDMSLAFAKLLSKHLSLGVSFHRFSYIVRGDGAEARFDRDPVGKKRLRGTELEIFESQVDLAGLYVANEVFGFGLGLYNLIPNSDIPEEIRRHSYAGFGIHYLQNPMIRYRMDIVRGFQPDDKPLTLSLGTELFWNKWIAFRMGEEYLPETGSTDISVGIGFDGPVFGVSYALAKGMHWLDLTMPF